MRTAKEILENLGTQTRIKINFGDPKTGIDWLEEYDTTGYIGKSTGTKPILLLVHNKRSMGGGAISTDNILKITETKSKKVLYKVDSYKNPNFEIKSSNIEGYTYSVYAYGQLISNHKTEKSAKLLISKLS